MLITFKFNHGDSVKDIITGFKGYIIGAHSYITGCNQYTVSPKIQSNNVLPEACVFDETRLTIDGIAKKLPVEKESKTGGPSPKR